MSGEISDDEAARLGCAGFSVGCVLAPVILLTLAIVAAVSSLMFGGEG